MSHKIHFILTGGTIDKIYDPIVQRTKSADASSIPPYVSGIIRPHDEITFETICLMDSLKIPPDVRQSIVNAAINAPVDRILITHGTDTLTKTADLIKNSLPDDNAKTIVLTGSVTPIKEFAMSDAGFNLGFALHTAQTQPPGVYICMNACVFEAGTVIKNQDNARFEFK